jgi:hypothetical protein
MTIDNFTLILRILTERKPFSAFTLEIFGGRLYEIDHPEAILVRNGIAVFAAPGSLPIWFDHESVNQIFDAPVQLVPDGPNQ